MAGRTIAPGKLLSVPDAFYSCRRIITSSNAAWTGILLVTKSWTTLVFDIAAFAQMQQWAIKKEKALRAEFPDKYKKKKYVLLPSPGAVIKYLSS